tara:strand:- start:295 stop:849 length:555 start_codon:yes stop_codon:yes gene_type:complete
MGVLNGLIALLLSTAAAGLIYYSWQRRGQLWAATIGWLLALFSTFVWSRALGPEIGVTYAIFLFICLAWVLAALNKEAARTDSSSTMRPYQAMHWPQIRDYVKHSVLFLLSVPATAAISMMLSVALVLHLPLSMLYKVTIAIFLYPLLWGALSVWVCAQEKLLKPTIACVGLTIIASLALFIRL